MVAHVPHVRQPAVAGYFYPADAAGLSKEIAGHLAAARADAADPPDQGRAPKAIIAPHAGYVYSGPVAASAYVRVAPARESIRRVVLLGPSHRVAFRGLAASTASAFETPLGTVPLDRDGIGRALALPPVRSLDEAHDQEHSLEVHLPFLQHLLDRFSLVPLVVGEAGADEVAEVLEALWDGAETLIVVSSDLSHYLGYDAARRLDLETCRAIETLAEDGIAEEGACGRRPVAGLLRLGRKLDLRATTVDLRNSGDIAGPRDRVVGYGAWTFEPNSEARLSDAHRRRLIETAAASIRHGLDHGEPLAVDVESFPLALRAYRAAFVTLKRGDALRGCIGTTTAHRPLCAEVAVSAWSAASADSRFPALTAAELAALELSVSVLGVPYRMELRDEPDLLRQLRPGRDGLILREGRRTATFLPQVWETLPDPAAFVGRLKEKAGLGATYWSPDIEAWRYSAESFSAPFPAAS